MRGKIGHHEGLRQGGAVVSETGDIENGLCANMGRYDNEKCDVGKVFCKAQWGYRTPFYLPEDSGKGIPSPPICFYFVFKDFQLSCVRHRLKRSW
jgi:hypothetical protein